MATDPHSEPENAVTPAENVLMLELVILPGEPVTGSVGLRGQPAPRPFHGWIDFMGALNSLRQSDPEGRSASP
jgi:hypothetical protein